MPQSFVPMNPLGGTIYPADVKCTMESTTKMLKAAKAMPRHNRSVPGQLSRIAIAAERPIDTSRPLQFLDLFTKVDELVIGSELAVRSTRFCPLWKVIVPKVSMEYFPTAEERAASRPQRRPAIVKRTLRG